MAHVKLVASLVLCVVLLEQSSVDATLVPSHRCADKASFAPQALVFLPVVLSTFELCVGLKEACEQ